MNRMARTFLLACGIGTFLILLPSQSPAMTASKSVLEARDGVYLNPNTGRFWTIDSFEGHNEFPLSLHKYLYGQGNPVNNIDPSGNDIGDVLDVTSIFSTFVSLPMGLPDLKAAIYPECVYVRANEDHAWICTEDLFSGVEHTYGRYANGYPRFAPVRSAGVVVDLDKVRLQFVSRGIRVKSFTPTINAGYDLYNNNCTTYAASEWKRASGESLQTWSWFGSATYDYPPIIKNSILTKNGGVKEVIIPSK